MMGESKEPKKETGSIQLLTNKGLNTMSDDNVNNTKKGSLAR